MRIPLHTPAVIPNFVRIDNRSLFVIDESLRFGVGWLYPARASPRFSPYYAL